MRGQRNAIAPPGQRWCSKCKRFQPLADFSEKDFYCREGRRRYERERKKPSGAEPVRKPSPPPDPIPVVTAPKPKPKPVPAAPPAPKPTKDWRDLPETQPRIHTAATAQKADPVPPLSPWTREATEHEQTQLEHGEHVVRQFAAAHYALDVLTSGWALTREAAE